MALRVAEFFQLDRSLIERVDSSTFAQAARRPLRTGFVIVKAQAELGYQPHSFEQGIALMDG
jgi:dTDP-4-dehydrorhamnose reductase